MVMSMFINKKYKHPVLFVFTPFPSIMMLILLVPPPPPPYLFWLRLGMYSLIGSALRLLCLVIGMINITFIVQQFCKSDQNKAKKCQMNYIPPVIYHLTYFYMYHYDVTMPCYACSYLYLLNSGYL